MTADVFKFDNGVLVFKNDISDGQLRRYEEAPRAIHEPVEEHWFTTVLQNAQQSQMSSQDRPFRFVDVGSALGYYCVLVKRAMPTAEIYAVDPSPHFRARMRETFMLNGLSPDDYTAVDRALYPHGKSVVFREKSFESSILQGADRTVEHENTIEVPTINLADVLTMVGGPIDLMKVDIQSAELALFNRNLEFLAAGHVNTWIVGTHSAAIHATVLEHFQRDHEILFESPDPDDQPDGLIVARYKRS
ncbi:MAG: FkbM family methyltransferase [Ahrensia sp.]